MLDLYCEICNIDATIQNSPATYSARSDQLLAEIAKKSLALLGMTLLSYLRRYSLRFFLPWTCMHVKARDTREESAEIPRGQHYQAMRASVYFLERRLSLNSRLLNGSGVLHECHEAHEESPRTPQRQRCKPILMKREFSLTRPKSFSPPPPLRPTPCVRC